MWMYWDIQLPKDCLPERVSEVVILEGLSEGEAKGFTLEYQHMCECVVPGLHEGDESSHGANSYMSKKL